MKKFSKVFNTVLDSVATALFLADTVVVILQVFTRFVLKSPIPFTEELGRYLLVFFGMLGLGICARKGEHLGAYFIRDKGKKTQPYIFLFDSIIVLITSLVFTYAAWAMIQLSGDKVAASMPWFKMSWLYWSFLLGMIITDFYAIRDVKACIEGIQGKRELLMSASSPVKED